VEWTTAFAIAITFPNCSLGRRACGKERKGITTRLDDNGQKHQQMYRVHGDRGMIEGKENTIRGEAE
jgi:hypothetical protein